MAPLSPLCSGVVPELGFAVGAPCAAKSAIALVLLFQGRNRGLMVSPWLGEERDTELGALHVQSRIDPWHAPGSALGGS